MRRGGRREGSGRPPKLGPAKREEIARKYYQRMMCWAEAVAIGRDPNMQRRWKIEKRMRQLAMRIDEPSIESGDPFQERTVKYHRQFSGEMEKLQAELDAKPNKPKIAPKRAKGPRPRFIRELAAEYGVGQRTIERCIDDFDFGK
jgi:hypothetical protein